MYVGKYCFWRGDRMSQNHRTKDPANPKNRMNKPAKMPVHRRLNLSGRGIYLASGWAASSRFKISSAFPSLIASACFTIRWTVSSG
jgi:hypothetical protein